MDLSSIAKPTLLLDKDKCKRNILRMTGKASDQRIELRPHFKTHQSSQIGEWFREKGSNKITVSSVGMAQYFVQAGWKDITIAFPLNIREIESIKSLSLNCKLGLMVLDPTTVDTLGKNTSHPIALWIKINVGTHRTGIDFLHHSDIDQILDRISHYPHLSFAGFIAHAGHAYQQRSVSEAQAIYDASLHILASLKSIYVEQYPDMKISLGDTPGASMVKTFGEVDELRPGNFVFYDLMQQEIGACSFDDIAVAVACPVVAVHPERKQWIIYGGAIHFSKDFLAQKDGSKCFGRMVEFKEGTWSTQNIDSNPMLISLSQEHGIVQCSEETFDLYKPGDLTFWLPVHSCLTADILGEYLTTDGELIDHYRQHLHD